MLLARGRKYGLARFHRHLYPGGVNGDLLDGPVRWSRQWIPAAAGFGGEGKHLFSSSPGLSPDCRIGHLSSPLIRDSGNFIPGPGRAFQRARRISYPLLIKDHRPDRADSASGCLRPGSPLILLPIHCLVPVLPVSFQPTD